MPGVLVGIVLIASLLLVHFSIRAQPLPNERPLDVDEGLPLPEVGQASTVFSLTALFGAYFGITVLLGAPALFGLAFGTALGLVIIRRWIEARKTERFEPFLFGLFDGGSRNATVHAMALSGAQCAYATSELLILREIARVSLGLKPEQATLVAIGVAIIGYFYVLFGGYMAVFRTDVVQFALVGAMGITFGTHLFRQTTPIDWSIALLPRRGYWTFPLMEPHKIVLYIYHFSIAAVMALGLLAASPDAWKRVFMVRRRQQKAGFRFLTLLVVGVTPFLLLLPFAMAIGPIPDGPINTGEIFRNLLTSNVLFIAAVLGLVASFLSSFNSALLASVHVALMLRRKKSFLNPEISRFHWLMVVALVLIYLVFSSLLSLSNPYLLGNLLLGPYALLAGIQVGTRANLSKLPENSLMWVTVLGLVGWFIYYVSVGTPNVPVTYQANSVPKGVLLFFLTFFACKLLIIGKARYDRHKGRVGIS